MIGPQELEARLLGWAGEYGGGRYEHIGYRSRNLLQTLIEHKGFVPSSRSHIPPIVRTAADEVEAVVMAMQCNGMYRPAMVLRCQYGHLHAPDEVKLARLRQIGLPMGRAAFFNQLAQAMAYVAGALGASVRKSA